MSADVPYCCHSNDRKPDAVGHFSDEVTEWIISLVLGVLKFLKGRLLLIKH